MSQSSLTEEEIKKCFQQLKKDAERSGYHLNPDEEFTKGLINGLLINEKRYGYWACPCRLATGDKDKDLDIICPCDYRDTDLNEYDTCYCGLYVSQKIVSGKKKITRIPERRSLKSSSHINNNNTEIPFNLSLPVYRCRVCGYLCAREEAPLVCPICKAKKERFERFL